MLGERKLLGLGFGGWLLNLTLAILIAFVVVLFAFQPVQVEGYSMMPHLQNRERLLIDKVSFGVQPLQRGDVVVFHYPLDPSQIFIKRIIGLPGDHLVIWDGTVYINGNKLIEPYVKKKFQDYADFSEVTVPPREYYVLGDHRNSSNDSRFWGCLPSKDIFGRAVFAYWPPADLGLIH
ncbi:MAG: signal peptidase I [Acidobacteria bacterium]|nr:MAG: signal peptidase I [Acidobacteriota bacterium]